MFRTETGHGDLASTRFAISPLNEVTAALVLLAGFRTDSLLNAWAAPKRRVLDQLRRRNLAVDVITTLWCTRGHQPDFTAPAPRTGDKTVADELEVVRATDVEYARADLDRALAEGGQRLSPEARELLAAPDVVDRLADGLEAAWTELIEPDWPAHHAILEQDLQYRAELLRSAGWAEALASLHPRFVWTDGDPLGAIEITRGGYPDEIHPSDGRGLLLIPSIFCIRVLVGPAWPRTLVYVARGKATLSETASPPEEQALERLLGRTRARLLRALDQPATTTQLTRQYHVSLGAAGHHLAALRAAGLISGTRAGQSVIYRRTELGEALVEAGSR